MGASDGGASSPCGSGASGGAAARAQVVCLALYVAPEPFPFDEVATDGRGEKQADGDDADDEGDGCDVHRALITPVSRMPPVGGGGKYRDVPRGQAEAYHTQALALRSWRPSLR